MVVLRPIMSRLLHCVLLIAFLALQAAAQYPPPAGWNGNNYRVQAQATAPGEFEVWWIAPDPDYKCVVQTYRRFSGMWILRETKDCGGGKPSLPTDTTILPQEFENPFQLPSFSFLRANAASFSTPRPTVQAAFQTPADQRLYVVEYVGQDRVRVLDTTDFHQVAEIGVDPSPQAALLTLGGKLLFVSHSSPPQLTIINTETNKIDAKLPMPDNTRPQWMALSPDGNTLYIDGYSSILVFDIASRKITGQIAAPTNGCFDRLALSADGNLLYALQACASPFGTTVIDTATGEIVTTVRHGSHGHGLAVSPNGRRVYASSFRGVEIIDAITNTILGFAPLDSSNFVQSIAVSFDGSTVVAADAKNGKLITIDGTTDEPVGETAINVGTGELFQHAGIP